MKNPDKHPLYRTWAMMKERCLNPNYTYYHHYGGRGIQVADEWVNNFDLFVYHLGDKPSPDHTLDRVDNNYHYCPENCRWATKAEQQKNARRSNYKDAKGFYPTRSGSYTSFISIANKRVYLGTFATKEEAAAAYSRVKRAFFGHLANYN